MVQWLRLHVSNVGDTNSIPGCWEVRFCTLHRVAKKKKKRRLERGDEKNDRVISQKSQEGRVSKGGEQSALHC